MILEGQSLTITGGKIYRTIHQDPCIELQQSMTMTLEDQEPRRQLEHHRMTKVGYLRRSSARASDGTFGGGGGKPQKGLVSDYGGFTKSSSEDPRVRTR